MMVFKPPNCHYEIRYHTRNWQIQQNLSIVTIICVLMGCFYRAAAIG